MAVIDYKGIADLEVPDEWDDTQIQDWVGKNQTQLDLEFGLIQPESGMVPSIKRGAKGLSNLLTEGVPGVVRSALGDEEGAARNLAAYQAREKELAAMYPRLVEGIENVNNVGDAWTYFKETLGEGLPSLLPSLLGGGLGGVLAKKIGTAGVEALAKTAATEAAKKQAMQVGLGSLAGATAAGLPQNTAETFAGIAEKNEGEQRPGLALGAGVIKSALDAIQPVAALKRGFGPQVGDAVVDRALAKIGLGGESLGKRAARGAVEGVAIEGVTEGAQEAIDVLAENLIKDNPDIFTKENVLRLANAGIGGGIVGGVVGGGAGAISERRPEGPAQPAVEVEPEVYRSQQPFFRKVEPGVPEAEAVPGEADLTASVLGARRDVLTGLYEEDRARKETAYKLSEALPEQEGGYTAFQLRKAAEKAGLDLDYDNFKGERDTWIKEGLLKPVEGSKTRWELDRTKAERPPLLLPPPSGIQVTPEGQALMEGNVQEPPRTDFEAARERDFTEKFTSGKGKKAKQEYLQQTKNPGAPGVTMDAALRGAEVASEEVIAPTPSDYYGPPDQNLGPPAYDINQLRMQAGRDRAAVIKAQEEKAAAQAKAARDAEIAGRQQATAETLEGAKQTQVAPVDEQAALLEEARKTQIGRKPEGEIAREARTYIEEVPAGEVVSIPMIQRAQANAGRPVSLEAAKAIREEAVRLGAVKKKGDSYVRTEQVPRWTTPLADKATEVPGLGNARMTPEQVGALADWAARVSGNKDAVNVLANEDLKQEFLSRGGQLDQGDTLRGFAAKGRIFLDTNLDANQALLTGGEEIFHLLQATAAVPQNMVEKFAAEMDVLQALLRKNGFDLSAYTPEELVKEVPAKAFALYNKQVAESAIDPMFRPPARRFFTKLRQAFRNMWNYVRGVRPESGPMSYADFFDLVNAGGYQGGFDLRSAVEPVETPPLADKSPVAASEAVLKEADRPAITGMQSASGMFGRFANNLWTPTYMAEKYPQLRPFASAVFGRHETERAMMTELDALATPFKNLKDKVPVTRAMLVLDNLEGSLSKTQLAQLIRRTPDGMTVNVPTNWDRNVAGSIEPGSIIALDKEQTAAFDAVQATTRAGLDKIKTIIQGAMTPELSKKQLASLRDLLGKIEALSRSYYVPHLRSGTHFASAKDAQGNLLYFRMGTASEMMKLRAELQEQFPNAAEVRADPVTYNILLEGAQRGLSVVDSMLGAMGTENSEVLGEFVKGLIDRAGAVGFNSMLRERSNVPGYVRGSDEDYFLERGLNHFIWRTSRKAAQAKHAAQLAEGQKAITAAGGGDTDMLVKWADNWVKSVDSPKNEAHWARSIASHWLLGFGNIGSAALQLTQIIQTAVPLFMSMGGTSSLASGLRQTLPYLKQIGKQAGGFGTGFDLEGPPPSGMSQETWNIIKELTKIGDLQPVNAQSLSADNELALKQIGMTRLGRMGMNALNFGMTLFSGAESFNRHVTAFAAIDLWRRTADKTLLKDAFQNYRMRGEEFNELNFVKFAVSKSNLDLSNVNLAPWQRGAMRLPTQFMNAPAQLFEFWLSMGRQAFGKDFLRSREAKAALTTMAITTFAISGLMGIPASDALKALIEKSYELYSGGEKINLEAEMQNFFIKSWGLTQEQASMMRRGVLRETLGVEIGQRVSLQDMIPMDWFKDPAALTAGGPLLNVLVQRGKEAEAKMAKDDVLGAISSLILPASALNLLKAQAAVPRQGIKEGINPIPVAPGGGRGFRNMKEETLIPAEKVTSGQALAQGMGFKPAEVAEMQELKQFKTAIDNRNAQRKLNLTNQLADLRLEAYQAQQANDPERAKMKMAEFQSKRFKLGAENAKLPPAERILITSEAINNKFQQRLRGLLDQKPSGAKQFRSEKARLAEGYR